MTKRFVYSQELADKSYREILDALFRLTITDCSTYAKTSKDHLKNGTALRLSACAGVMRMVVEMGVRKLRFKTVKALVEHIIRTLPMSNKVYCEHLLADYFKSLSTVLEYHTHSEHLSGEECV